MQGDRKATIETLARNWMLLLPGGRHDKPNDNERLSRATACACRSAAPPSSMRRSSTRDLRTKQFIDLTRLMNTFRMEFVTEPGFGGAYKLVSRATPKGPDPSETPTSRSRSLAVLHLACHEGYPGHHVYKRSARDAPGKREWLGRVHGVSAVQPRNPLSQRALLNTVMS